MVGNRDTSVDNSLATVPDQDETKHLPVYRTRVHVLPHKPTTLPATAIYIWILFLFTTSAAHRHDRYSTQYNTIKYNNKQDTKHTSQWMNLIIYEFTTNLTADWRIDARITLKFSQCTKNFHFSFKLSIFPELIQVWQYPQETGSLWRILQIAAASSLNSLGYISSHKIKVPNRVQKKPVFF